MIAAILIAVALFFIMSQKGEPVTASQPYAEPYDATPYNGYTPPVKATPGPAVQPFTEAVPPSLSEILAQVQAAGPVNLLADVSMAEAMKQVEAEKAEAAEAKRRLEETSLRITIG